MDSSDPSSSTPLPSTPPPPADTTTTTTTTEPASLLGLLLCDIQPKGHRLIFPFLTLKDYLALSECCQGLVHYRYRLSRVSIIPQPTPRDSIHCLLSAQPAGALQHLRLSSDTTLHVLDLASQGVWRELKTLDLSNAVIRDFEGIASLERALSGGGLKDLLELEFGQVSCRYSALSQTLQALQHGACPRLQSLTLLGTMLHDDFDLPGLNYDPAGASLYAYGGLVAEALASGNLKNLRELRLCVGLGGAGEVARALGTGACPELVCLMAPACFRGEGEAQALAEALRSGALAKLEKLDLRFSRLIGGVGFVAIFGAFEAGGCPNLKQLHIDDATLTWDATMSLVRALTSSNCQHVHFWGLSRDFADRHASLQFLTAIEERGGMPSLMYLDLSWAALDSEHGRVLGRAIGRVMYPRLELLNVCNNELLGDDGAVAILAGLGSGGCPHLKYLGMLNVGMGAMGGHAVGQALASGKLSGLDQMHLHQVDHALGDEAMVEIVLGLSSCRRLRSLDLQYMSVGSELGQVLVHTLGQGIWPNLEVINLSGNHGLWAGLVGAGEALAGVLIQRGLPRLKVVDLRFTGLAPAESRRLLEVVGANRRGLVMGIRLEEGDVDSGC